jgi:hypothetical protein
LLKVHRIQYLRILTFDFSPHRIALIGNKNPLLEIFGSIFLAFKLPLVLKAPQKVILLYLKVNEFLQLLNLETITTKQYQTTLLVQRYYDKPIGKSGNGSIHSDPSLVHKACLGQIHRLFMFLGHFRSLRKPNLEKQVQQCFVRGVNLGVPGC